MKKYVIKKDYYGENYVEVTTYNQPVYVGYHKPPEQTTYLDGSPKPNEGKMLKFDTIEQALEYMQINELTKKYKSLKRAKKKITEIIMANISSSSYFHTYTFDKNITDVYQANKVWSQFIRRLKNVYNVNFAYICIPERQPISKRIHYHVIIFNGFNMKQSELRKIWNNGFIKIKKIRDISNPKKLANYFVNYMTKEEQNDEITGKKYFTSTNIKRKTSVFVEDYETIEQFFEDIDGATEDSKREWYTKYGHKTLIKLSN